MKQTNKNLLIDLEKLENLVTTSDGWQARCPVCAANNEDRTNKNHLGIQRDGKFNCLKYSGDKEHLRGVLELVGVDSEGVLSSQYFAPIEPKLEMPESWPLSKLDELIKEYSYWVEKKGVSAETCKRFHIGIGTKGKMAGRTVIPIFDEGKTKIIGCTGRLLDYTDWHKKNKVAKWKHGGSKESFILVGDEQQIITLGWVILVESPACLLYLYERGIKNVICIFGVVPSGKIISKLLGWNPKRIIIATNNEPDNKFIGNRAAEKIKTHLLQFFNQEKIIINLPPTKDFSDLFGTKDEKNTLDNWVKNCNSCHINL